MTENTAPEQVAVDDRFEEPEIKEFDGITMARWSAATPPFEKLESVARAFRAIAPDRADPLLYFHGDRLDVSWHGDDPTDAEMEAVEDAWLAVGGKTTDHNWV